jgi:hypothetical protein
MKNWKNSQNCRYDFKLCWNFVLCFLLELIPKMGSRFVDNSTFWKGAKFERSVNVKQMYVNRAWKSRRRQECQELTSKMCWHNMESETSAQTIMLHIRPSPIHVSAFVSCSPGVRRDPIIRFWSSISLTFLWAHTRPYVNTWHENDAGSWETTSCFMYSSHHYVCEYVATRPLASQELFAMSHAEIYEQNKTYDIWTSVCTWAWNMNACTAGSQSMWYQHWSSSKSWTSRLVQCRTALLHNLLKIHTMYPPSYLSNINRKWNIKYRILQHYCDIILIVVI